MSEGFLLSIDQGTTGTTALVFDRDCRIRGRGYSEFTQHYPRPGWVEHDAEEIWRVSTGAVRYALSSADADARELRANLDEWISATNARDIDRQMKFYEPRVAAYYLSRNASREAVRAEKEHVFARASAVDVRAGDPEISISPDGQTATMRFRKDYTISGDGLDKRGAVIQELRWRRTPHGWRITSERDLRVVP